jgi:hypothetical protein
VLSEHNQLSPAAAECPAPAQELIIQVDGGHIPIQEKGQRSFEALAAIVYRPEALQAVDPHHRQIMEKTCVLSAVDDQLQTIKTCGINAAKKQGISQATQVTALADGAKNCWAVVAAIQPACATLECILDWFHIAQKFQNVEVAHLVRVATRQHLGHQAIIVGRLVARMGACKPVPVLGKDLLEDLPVPRGCCKHQGTPRWGVRMFGVQRFYRGSLASSTPHRLVPRSLSLASFVLESRGLPGLGK